MLKGISSDNFEIKLLEDQGERGISLYNIIGLDYDDSLRFDSYNFEAIDELIELLKLVKQNNIK